MHTLIFATNNLHKLDEVRSIPGLNYDIIGLKEAGIDIEIPEPYDTLEQNASEKSGVIYSLTGKDCFSEDTGLEVDALNGEPGVKSARYAGDDRSFSNNIEKLLYRMEGKSDRRARFRAVISLMLGGKEYIFEGICKGTILADIRGNEGFGYDPVFVPEGATKTFAEMDIPEKNRYSHRKKAIDRLTRFLNDHFNK
jgi:XTP/dITP diphosphohydrolase